MNIAEIVAAVTGAMQGTRINQNSTIKKQEPPKFSGRLEDYPRFKRHWDNMVSENRITIPQQLRILEESLPASNKVIRTQVANCQSTDAAWAILQAKFGNSEDLLQNRMSLLEDYKPPAHAKTRYQKFEAFNCTWTQVWSDLMTLGKTSELDRILTFRKFVSHLDPESQTRWVQHRAMTKAFNPRSTDRDMFNDWLPGEEKLLKELDSMDPNNKPAKDPKDGSKDPSKLTCHGCGKTGHKQHECPEGKKKKCKKCGRNNHDTKDCRNPKNPPRSNNHGSAGAACPKCKDNHTWKDRSGVEKPSTRLTNCPQWMKDSPDAKAKLIESVKGCQRCTDYTGTHQVDSCSFPYDCYYCQRKHNKAFHGSTVKYVDQANAVILDESQIEDKENVNLQNAQSLPEDQENAVILDEEVEEIERTDNHGCQPAPRMENPVVTTDIRNKWRIQAASKADIHMSAQEARHTIFKAEELNYLDPRGHIVPGSSFYDDGSNIAYVQRKFAKQLGLKSTKMPVPTF